MAEEVPQYSLTHKELVTLLVKHLDIHEGHWQLSVAFGLGAGNMGDSPENLNPVAFVMVGSVGIRKVEEANSLTVDASATNPLLRSIEDGGAGVGVGVPS